MRTARYAHGMSWDYLTGNTILLIKEMSEKGYRLVDSSPPEHKKETEGFMGGLVATLYFDNDDVQTANVAAETSVVHVEGSNIYNINKRTAEVLASHPGFLISVSPPVMVNLPGDMGKTLVSTLIFRNITKPSTPTRLDPQREGRGAARFGS